MSFLTAINNFWSPEDPHSFSNFLLIFKSSGNQENKLLKLAHTKYKLTMSENFWIFLGLDVNFSEKMIWYLFWPFIVHPPSLLIFTGVSVIEVSRTSSLKICYTKYQIRTQKQQLTTGSHSDKLNL